MKKVRKKYKLTHVGCLAIFLLLVYWVWMFYSTQSATEQNTYKCSETVIDIDIRLASHRGSDKLYIVTEHNRYMLDTGWRNKIKSHDLAKNILARDQDYEMIVWKHIPKHLSEAKATGLQVYQVVDLKCDEYTYWDITSHNSFQKVERITGIIAGVFLSIVTTTFNFFVMCSRKDTRGHFSRLLRNRPNSPS